MLIPAPAVTSTGVVELSQLETTRFPVNAMTPSAMLISVPEDTSTGVVEPSQLATTKSPVKNHSQSDKDDISDYIGRYILTEDTMQHMLKRIVNEGHINWYEMAKPEYEHTVRDIIHQKISKAIQEAVGLKKKH